MTATGMIVLDDAVHLVTDAAYYDASGKLVELRSKVTPSETFQMAIACSGCVKPYQVAIRLEAVRSQSEALAKLRDVVVGIRAENAAANPTGEATGHNDLMLFAALWSERSGRPEGWVIASHRAFLGDAYEPYTLIEVERLACPPSPLHLAPFEAPEQDALALLQCQRSWADADGATIVGGWGELTTITRQGIAQVRLVDWFDEAAN